MARGKRFKRHPLPLALPHPGFKSGTFYLAEKRNFLFCVDTHRARIATTAASARATGAQDERIFARLFVARSGEGSLRLCPSHRQAGSNGAPAGCKIPELKV
jgi:hypothetical protein